MMKRILCSILTGVAIIATAGENVWLGKSPGWEDSLNWSLGKPPAATDENDVKIPAGCEAFPSITSDAVIAGRLTMEEGARIELSGNGTLAMGITPFADGKFDAAMRVRRTVTSAQVPSIASNTPPPFVKGVVTVATNTIGPELPVGLELSDIAPSADLSSVPYIAQLRNLVDEDPLLRTRSAIEKGSLLKSTRVDFRFDKPHSIATVMWSVPYGAWAILADMKGNGEFDTLLRADFHDVIKQPKGGTWKSRTWIRNDFWPAVEGGRGIRLVTLFKSPYHFAVKILEPGKDASPASPVLAEGVPALTAGETVKVPAPPVSRQFRKGYHVEPWMFGIQGWLPTEKKKRPFLSEYPQFTNFVNDVKGLHANTVNIWPLKTFCGHSCGKGTYEHDVLWPSRYDKWPIREYGKPEELPKLPIDENALELGEDVSLDDGALALLDEKPVKKKTPPPPPKGEDVLKVIVDAFQKAGITVFTMERCPYPRPLEEFPPTETRDKPAPYIARHGREFLKGFVLEQVERGVDGVGIGYDEQFRSVANPAKANDVTKAAFRERFGIEVPDKAGDTEAYRKWVVFAYEQFASYLGEAAAAAKRMNPKVATKTPTHVNLGNMWNDRIKVGIAEDIVGEIADIDYFRAYAYEDAANLGHYVSAYATQFSLGANRGRGPASLHNCPWADSPVKFPGYYLETTPVYISGPPVSSIMHGGRMPLYWRHNLIYRGGSETNAMAAFSILDTLAAWGAREAEVPGTIVVLKSRASEDWWQLRQRYAPEGDPVDQSRGFLYDKWLNELLLSNGYPFRTCYLDHPDDFSPHVMAATVVLVPFPYSIGDEAVKALAAAAAKGVKVVLFGAKGETDEWGRKRPEPAFGPMIADGRAEYVADDMVAVGQHKATRAKILAKVDSLLGDAKPAFLETYGDDVEMSLLVKGERERYLCLINWTDRDVTVDAGVNLPAGAYRVMLRDLKEVARASIGGKGSPDSAALKRFRINLAPWEIKVLYIAPEETR